MMDLMVFFFLENMALVISYTFLVLKLKEFYIKRFSNFSYFFWLTPLLAGFISILIMYNPFVYQEMRLDLREVPLFFISYLGGWKLGILSAICPSIYRVVAGGPTVIQGVVQTILLPVLLGSIFHNKKQLKPPYSIINIKHMLIGFCTFEAIRFVLTYTTTPATFTILVALFVYSTIGILGVGLMWNDANRNLLIKNELEFYSSHDSLTRLPNIRHFNQQVNNFIHQKVPFAIVMFDVDHFKHYNDAHGHQAGDMVLRDLGKLLSECVDEKGITARYGGEEFIICYPNVESKEAVIAMAELFRHKVENYSFEGKDMQPGGNITISLGISFNAEGKSLEETIREADISLYQSKQKGRNQLTIFRVS